MNKRGAKETGVQPIVRALTEAERTVVGLPKVNSPEYLAEQRLLIDKFIGVDTSPESKHITERERLEARLLVEHNIDFKAKRLPEAKHTDIEAKYKPHLVSEEFIQAVAEVRAYGVKKYGHEDGWQITPDIEYLDAAARHINKTIAALQHGNMSELYDDELVNDERVGSGLLNLAHAACDIMFIITKIQNNQSELVAKIKEMEDAK